MRKSGTEHQPVRKSGTEHQPPLERYANPELSAHVALRLHSDAELSTTRRGVGTQMRN